MVEPRPLVLPPGRQLQREVRFTYGDRVLKFPLRGHEVRLRLPLDLVADDAAGHGRRNPQNARAQIAHELAVHDTEETGLYRVFVSDRVVLALRWDAPCMHALDLRPRIVVDAHGAAIRALDAQNFEHLAFQFPDTSVRQYGHSVIGIQQGRVRLRIVVRHRRTDLRAHPRWGVGRASYIGKGIREYEE